MQPLAQIQLPTTILDILWDRADKTVSYTHKGTDTTLADESIGATLARHLNRQIHELYVTHFHYIEHPNEPVPATQEMYNQLLQCNWSDYANDNMFFQCTVRIKNT